MNSFLLFSTLVYMVMTSADIKRSFIIGKDDNKILTYFGFNELPMEKSFQSDSLIELQPNNTINFDTMNAKCGYSLYSSNGSLHWAQITKEKRTNKSAIQSGLTIAFWIYVNKITNHKTTILAINDRKSNSFFYSIRLENLYLVWEENFIHKQIFSVIIPVSLPTDSWNHVAFIHNFETGKIEFYLNSSKVLVEFANNSIPRDFSLSMVDGVFFSDFYFYGNIDEFYIINERLTYIEIFDLIEYCTKGPSNFPLAIRSQYDFMKDEKSLQKHTPHSAIKRHLYSKTNHSLMCDATVLEHTPFYPIKSATNILNKFTVNNVEECINNCCILDDCQMAHFNGTSCDLIDCAIPSLCQPSYNMFPNKLNSHVKSTLVYTNKQGQSILFNKSPNISNEVNDYSNMLQPDEDLVETSFCNDRSTISGKAGIQVNGSYKEVKAEQMKTEKICNETCCATKQCYLYVYEPLTKYCLLYLCTSKSGCDVDFISINNSYKFVTKQDDSINVKIPNKNHSNNTEIKWNYIHNKTTEDSTSTASQNWVSSSNVDSTLPKIKNMFDNYTLLIETLKDDFNKYKDETLNINHKASSTTISPLKLSNSNFDDSSDLFSTTQPLIHDDYTCDIDYIFENVVIPDRTIAVLVIRHPNDNVYGINECGSFCCDNQMCDIGYLKGRKCFLLSCTNKKLCYFTSRSNTPGNTFKQAVVYVKRHGVSLFENLLKNKKPTQIQPYPRAEGDTQIKFHRKSSNGVCLYSYPIQAKLLIWNIPMSFFNIELSTNLENCQDSCCRNRYCFSAYQHEGYCFLVVCKINNKHRCFKYTRPPYVQNGAALNSLLVYIKRRKIKHRKKYNNLNVPNASISEIGGNFTDGSINFNPTSTVTPLSSQQKFNTSSSSESAYPIQSYYGNNYQYTPYTFGFPWKPFQNFFVSELASKKSLTTNDYWRKHFNANSQAYEQPPKIKDIKPSKIVLEQHLSVTFHCESEGFPQPKISWSMLNRQVSSTKRNNFYTDNLEPLKNDDRITSLNEGYLIINNIHPSDSGIYVCTAMNDYGSVYSEASLEVLDVNECNLTNGITPCKHTCINTVGSYYCKCFSGYELSTLDNSTCADIDECQSKLTNNCDQLCVNTEGGYICQCLSGYQMSSSNACKDINECVVMKNPCGNGVCKNTMGSFLCECDSSDDYFSKETNQCIRNRSLSGSTEPPNDFTIFKRSFYVQNKLFITGMVLCLLLLVLAVLLIVFCVKYRCSKPKKEPDRSMSLSG